MVDSLPALAEYSRGHAPSGPLAGVWLHSEIAPHSPLPPLFSHFPLPPRPRVLTLFFPFSSPRFPLCLRASASKKALLFGSGYAGLGSVVARPHQHPQLRVRQVSPFADLQVAYADRPDGYAHQFEHLASHRIDHRSEEHTSELQSPCNLVCRLLLEKKRITLETMSGVAWSVT